MKKLVLNEIHKMKSSLSFLFILFLMLIPLLLNIMSLFLSSSGNKSAVIFYFMNYNQNHLLFPLSYILIVTNFFYNEYKNGMYLTWLSYGYSKKSLFLSKLIISFIVALVFSAICYLLLIFYIHMIRYGLTYEEYSFIDLTLSYWSYCISMLLLYIPLGSLMINILRNSIISISIGIGMMIGSAIMMAAPFSYWIPFSFPYRWGLYFLSSELFYENMEKAMTVGATVYFFSILIFFILHKFYIMKNKKIETN